MPTLEGFFKFIVTAIVMSPGIFGSVILFTYGGLFIAVGLIAAILTAVAFYIVLETA